MNAVRRLWTATITVLTALALLVPSIAAGRQPARTIVLIGGDTPHNPGVHEASNGVRRIAMLLEATPAISGKFAIRAYPDGWPADTAALDAAATILWYFEGLEHHPLRDPARRTQFAKLMKRGVGLVTLHQASPCCPTTARSTSPAGWAGYAME